MSFLYASNPANRPKLISMAGIESGINVEDPKDVLNKKYLDSNISIDGTKTFIDTTQSVDKNSGVVVLEGGLGVEKNVNIGGDVNVAGDLEVTSDLNVISDLDVTGDITSQTTITDTTESTTKDNGALVLENGGLGVEGNVNIGGDLRANDIFASGGVNVTANIGADGLIAGDGGTVRGEAGTLLKEKVIEIGDWNMDSAISVDITHGLGSDFKKIRSLQAVIRNDSDTFYYPLDAYAGANMAGGPQFANSTIIQLRREQGGIFDNANFDSTSYNRGWVYILYAV